MDGLMMKYFVLKPSGTDIFAAASRRAMSAYADTIAEENPEFARDIREWVGREWVKTPGAKKAGEALLNQEPGR